MPFAYYGAKHELAPKYPRPRHRVIVEPFAGSAAYSVFHARHVDRVILIDADPAVVDLWHRVKAMSGDDLNSISECLAHDERTTDPILGALAGSSTLDATLSGRSRKITPRMRQDWPHVARRMSSALPHLHKFDISLGTYADAPDIEGTWFVDPPYQPITSSEPRSSGNAYRHGAASISYERLSDWCRTRRGFVMVCEQSPASWLPFSPFARLGNSNGTARTEVIWRNDLEQPSLFGDAA